MRLTKINNLKYKVDNDGIIYVENDQLYFTIKTAELIEVIYKFLNKIKDDLESDFIYYQGDDPFLNDQFPKIDDEVVIYLRAYIYNVKNEYLSDEQIDQLFKERGNWQKGEGKYVDLLYLQGDKYFHNRKFWTVESLIFNKVDRDSIRITKKDKQHQIIAPGFRENFLSPQIYFEITPQTTSEFAKDFIEKYKVVIMKPADGYSGKGIKIITNLEEFEKEIKILKKEKKEDNWSRKSRNPNYRISNLYWVLEKYIIDPHLYKCKKYHFRVYFIHSVTGKSFIYKRFRLAIAEEDYQALDFHNKDIHDTHFTVKEDIKLVYLDEILKKQDYQKILEEVIILFGNIASNLNMKCYRENAYCFEIFAADLMLEKDLSIKLLEINTNPGFNKKVPACYDILKNSLYHIVDDILPPQNKIEDEPDDFLPVYLKRERNPRGKISLKEFNFIDELAKAWHSEGYGPKSKKDKTGGYYLTCKEGDINKNDFHIHVVGPNGKNHINSWSRKIKERRKWEELDFRLTPKEQAYHIYVKSGYRKHQNCLDYYKKYGKKK